MGLVKSLLVGALGGKLAAGKGINITLPETKSFPAEDTDGENTEE